MQDTQNTTGLFHKFHVSRVDGKDAPGEKHHGARYFVLDLDNDPHSRPALRAYAESCEEALPQLATELLDQIDRILPGTFITVPKTTLPNGTVVPTFQISQYLCSRDTDGTPWVEINYRDARQACEQTSAKLITELQALAIAHDIAAQDINWSGGKVGEGHIYQGLHKFSVENAQPPSYEPTDPDERRWHQLSNGERIFDFAGNAYTWVFDDVQGDENGITAKPFAEDSPSITAPYPSMEKGMGWRPDAGTNWSGNALVRGGCWGSGRYAGAFDLNRGFPDREWDNVGFRCTK